MSSSITIWPIIKSLLVASQFLGIQPAKWQATNDQQTTFLNNNFSNHHKIDFFKSNELRAWASRDAQMLNTILKNEGFSIQLEPFETPDSFGVVSILDVQLEWQEKGEKTTIQKNNVLFDAVTMNQGFKLFSANNHSQPIACIKTQSNDTVWITIADHETPLRDFALLQWIQAIKNDRVPNKQNYRALEFPMVDFDQESDISWLLNMRLKNYVIAQALQQTKLKMNEAGARVKSAAAIEVRLVAMPPIPMEEKLIIDKPFYLWIERPGVTDPIFAGYITEQDWNDPKNLDL